MSQQVSHVGFAVYGCIDNPAHIVYVEPELSGLPGGLITCPFKHTIRTAAATLPKYVAMELRHGIRVATIGREDTGTRMPMDEFAGVTTTT